MNRKRITIPALFLTLFVMAGFLLHLIVYSTSGMVFCALIMICVVGLGVTKPIIRRAIPSYYLLIWLAVLTVLWVNCIARYRSNDVLIDDVVITCGYLIILLFSAASDNYCSVLSVMLFLALFFATGVYLQRFLPGIYRIVISFFPSRLQDSMVSGLTNVIGVKGFTINSGFTANYVIIGIFVVASRISDRIPSRKTIIRIAYLGLALLLTGKRGPILALMLSAVLVGIIPVRGTKRMKKIWRFFLVILVLIVTFFSFGSFLEQVPYIGRYIESINDFINGEDISSGRTRLYAWAIQLFIRSPLLGIGWGKYRTTVAGNATFIKSLETHNVYLQLLCETGIIGFLFFVTMFLMSWNMTKNSYCACLKEYNEELKKWKPLLFFSFSYQTYFLLLCFTENPLYDQFHQIIYAFCCSIMIAYRYISSLNGNSFSIKKRGFV